MATSTRKPTARKPRKAAGVKKTTPKKKVVVAPVEVQEKVTPVTEEVRQAKLEAYHTLKSVGADVPVDLATEVEGWIADLQAQRDAEVAQAEVNVAEHQRQIAEANKNGPWYVRNGYPAPFNIRLDRQTEQRRIELKPRGKPGDLHPIKDEDLKDPVLKQNLVLGLIEIIPAGEATQIIEKQTNNMSHRVHTPLQVLRNELGETYKQGAVKVEAEFNSQGVTVAQVDPRVLQGQAHDREVGGSRGSGGLTRVHPGQAYPNVHEAQAGESDQAMTVVRSGFVPTGSNPAIVQYGPTGDNAKISDDIARRKDIQGPNAGLGDVQVVVEPVRRT